MRHVLLSIFLILFLCGAVCAKSPVPQDFAKGMILKTSGDRPFFSLEVPAGLYRKTVRADLGDIRVFNSANKIVPHVVTRPESTSEPVHPPVSLPFFPVFGDRQTPGSSGGERVSLHINTAEDGTIINVEAGEKPQADTGRLRAVLLDLSSLEAVPAELVLEWDNKGKNFVTGVSVDGSENLTRWERVVDRAGLAEQHFAGHTLHKNRIALPVQNFASNYLRINWPVNAPDLTLTKVRAVFAETRSGPKPQWRQIKGKLLSKNDTKAYEFDTKGAFPVDRVNIVLPEQNSLIRAEIQSRPDKRSEWSFRQKGVFYNLNIDGTFISNDPLTISMVKHRYWRIKTAPGTGGPGGGSPALKIGWVPHRLIFLARGKAPFTVAYGSTVVEKNDASVENVLRTIEEKNETAVTGKAVIERRVVLGGEKALKKPYIAISWKTLMLWAILVAAVFLLGFMALRLYREMNN